MFKKAIGVVGAALFVLSACAGDVVTVDRTQPNKVQKSTLAGEWFFVPTVVDADYNQGYIFEGLLGDSERLRWDIRENLLVAYRTYAVLEGQEQTNNESGDGSFKGSVVAAFPIESHFDVRRDYNPATGEQSNVLVENTTDRPWWEREYMRIDWSMNVVSDPYSFFGFLNAFSSAPFYVQENDVDNEFRAEVTADNINVVGNYNMMPDVDTCYYLLQDWQNCGGSAVKIKLSFMKVGNRDYEPLYYPDRLSIYDDNGMPFRDCDSDNDGMNDGECSTAGVPMLERFGYFRTERLAYDDEFQWTREGRVFLANRWNIWKRTYNNIGQALPMEARDPKRVTYYTNVDFPGDLVGSANKLVGQWDDAFRKTVAGLKGVTNLADVDTVFELKLNNCNIESANAYASANDYTDLLSEHGIGTVAKGNLKRACTLLEWASNRDDKANKFVWQKPGDLRWSYMHWVDTPQHAGPLGYGPVAADPLTGEILQGYANVYGAALETYAAYAADTVQLMNGQVDVTEFANGTFAREQLERNRGFGGQYENSFSGEYSAQKLDELSRRFAPMKQKFAQQSNADVGRTANETGFRALRGKGSPEAAEFAMTASRAELQRVAGSRIEREILTTDEMRRALNPNKVNPLDGSIEAQDFSSIKWMLEDRTRKSELEAQLNKHGCVLTQEWADEGLGAITRAYAGKSWDEVYQLTRAAVFEGVMAHEVGHTLGLRHNFEGSYDALNFHPKFWEAYNPTTGEVSRTGDAELYMYSSIMDYMPRPYDDIVGIGPYDTAAIKFGYGQLVEIFDGPVAAAYFGDLKYFYDYADLPKLLSGENACTSNANCSQHIITGNTHYNNYVNAANAGNMALARQEYEKFNREVTTYLVDAIDTATPRVENLQKRKNIPFKTLYDGWRDYYKSDFNDYDVFNYEEVPYMFCPDEWVYPGNLTCQRWDKGANYKELIQDRWQRYDQYYFLSNFKRDRASFNDGEYINSYISRLMERTLSPMSAVYRYYLYGFSGVGRDTSGNYLTMNDFPVGRDWQAAGMDGLNYLSTIIHQPDPGSYCLNTADNSYEPLEAGAVCGSGQTMEVPVGAGKYFLTDWTNDYNYKATRIGTYWDKFIALWAVTDNEGFFYRDFSDFLDSGAFSLSYWRGLNDEMLKLFGSAFSGDEGDYAWRYNASSAAKYIPRPVVDIYATPVSGALPKIKSATSWNLRYYSVMLALARFNSMYDYTEDFGNYARVCLEGYSDCLTYASAPEEYTDPLTQLSYVAPTSAATQAAGKDLGAQLLRDARGFATNVYAPRLARYTAAKSPSWSPNLTTPGTNPGDLNAEEVAMIQAGKTLDDLRFRREVELGAAERGINDRSSFLDIIRNLSKLTEFGG